MINLHHAILANNPSVVTVRGDIAYDNNNNIVEYDVALAEAKLLEMKSEMAASQQAAETSKASALSKLAALGLSADEIKALTGVQA